VIVVPGTEADAPGAAALHAAEISEGFLPTLGPVFLRRLYRRIVRSEGSFLLVSSDELGLVGMASATEDVGGLYRAFLVKDGPAAAVAAAPRLLRSWRKVIETLHYPAAERALPSAELLSVAVAPRGRGQGLGAELVAGVNEELRRRGVDDAKVVAAADNKAALRLYEAAGYRRTATIEVHGGAPSEVLTWH